MTALRQKVMGSTAIMRKLEERKPEYVDNRKRYEFTVPESGLPQEDARQFAYVATMYEKQTGKKVSIQASNDLNRYGSASDLENYTKLEPGATVALLLGKSTKRGSENIETRTIEAFKSIAEKSA